MWCISNKTYQHLDPCNYAEDMIQFNNPTSTRSGNSTDNQLWIPGFLFNYAVNTSQTLLEIMCLQSAKAD